MYTQAHLSLIAFALALVALVAFALMTFTASATSTPSSVATSIVVNRPLPMVFSDGSCGNGVYVTGDLAGDASPSSVYAVMCPSK